MDEVTQQNAALVEEAAAAAESLEEQAHGLRQAVAMFSLEGAGSAVTPQLTFAAPARHPAHPDKKVSGPAKRLPPPQYADDGEDEWAEF